MTRAPCTIRIVALLLCALRLLDTVRSAADDVFDRVEATGAIDQMCCLCDNCDLVVDDRERWQTNVKNRNGKKLSCYDLDATWTPWLRPNSDSCKEIQDKERKFCCDKNHQSDRAKEVKVEKPKDNNPYKKEGNQDFCSICKDGSFPKIPHTRLAVLDPDTGKQMNGNCEDFYWMGQMKHLPNKLCNIFRLEALDTCGCRGEGDGPPPTRSNCDDCKSLGRKSIGNYNNYGTCVSRCKNKGQDNFSDLVEYCPHMCMVGVNAGGNKWAKAKYSCELLKYC